MTTTSIPPEKTSAVPLVAHVVHRFDYGGMENGLVNLINTMDRNVCRHAVIALTEATDFADRLTNSQATVHGLDKRPGKDPSAYLRLWKLLRTLRPAILHTRNIGTLDCALVGKLAGVPVCLHGEHGWDIHDPDGTKPRYRRLRKFMNPMVKKFITVSQDLADWLIRRVGIPADKVATIRNGVDTTRFRPGGADRTALPAGFADSATVIVGSVTRFQEIKDPLALVRAFIAARERLADTGTDLRLVMAGDGPLKPAADALLRESGHARHAWLPGMRDDIANLMRSFDIFVLSSRREGISNTILEALATGVPVVATRTGGNPELVDDGVTGVLVAPESADELADTLVAYAGDAERRRQHGQAARARAERDFSLAAMAAAYQAVYTAALTPAGS